MSYDFCVVKPDYAADRDALHAAWNDDKYWPTSSPDSDRSAEKWRTKDLLMGFDERLRWKEPQGPKTGLVGLFAKWFGKPAQPLPYLSVYLDDDEGLTNFHVFDEAIEISLPWESPNINAEKHVHAVWRHLEQLSAAGWSTIYDTERGVLLDLTKDFDAVTARYRENLGPDEADELPPGAGTSTAKPATKANAKVDKPFTGNVG
jgi:hypothetical protein